MTTSTLPKIDTIGSSSQLERCPAYREFGYSKMPEKRLEARGQLGLRDLEVLYVRELTVVPYSVKVTTGSSHKVFLSHESENLRKFLHTASDLLK